jgi:hypothetical protein
MGRNTAKSQRVMDLRKLKKVSPRLQELFSEKFPFA